MTTNPKSAEALKAATKLYNMALEGGIVPPWDEDTRQAYETVCAALTQADHGDEVCLSKSAENERQSDLSSVNEKQADHAEKLAEALREIDKQPFHTEDNPYFQPEWRETTCQRYNHVLCIAREALADFEASKNGESHD